MTAGKWELDPKETRVRVHTFAEGMLARLAKNLELSLPAKSGSLEIGEDGRARADIVFAIDDVTVAGVLTGDAVDAHALSSGDRSDIVKKLAHAVGAEAARAEAKVAGTTSDEKDVAIELTLPCGSASGRSTLDVKKANARIEANGKVAMSLRALGVAPVKGPMGAFRLSDEVTIVWRAVFTAR